MGKDVVILDGGLSTQMNQYVGYNFNKDPLWTSSFLLKNPDSVKQTHLDFLRAGSDIIETNTYQASIPGFMQYLNLNEQEAQNLMKKAAKIAQEAVEVYKKENPNANPTIFGSIGPYGTSLHDGSEYTGAYTDYTPEETIIEWHKPRFEMLLEAGLTHFAIETIPSEKEAIILANFIKSYPQIKAWIAFSCKDDQHLAHGENFQKAALNVYQTNPEQLIAVGVNCLNPSYVTNLLKGINVDNNNKIPLVVYPNNGDVYLEGEWRERHAPPLTSFVKEWIKIGVKYIGGCCRTFAPHIQQIKEAVQNLE